MSDTLNLDSRDYRDGNYDGLKVGRKLFRDALTAIRRRPVIRSLSVLIISHYQSDYVRGIMAASPGLDAVLAAPAVRSRLEELRVELRAEFGGPCDIYAVLDAAPRLARLWLESVMFTAEDVDYGIMCKRRVLLRCPAATASVAVLHCHWTAGLDVDAPGARSLRYTGFVEHFPLGRNPAAAPANLLQDVQLSFCTARRCSNHPSSRGETPPPPHALFWDAIGRFSRLRALKLELMDINDIAAAVIPEEEEEEGVPLLGASFPELVFLELEGSHELELMDINDIAAAVIPEEEEEGVPLLGASFPELMFLELEGSHEVDSHGAAAAIADLLMCCPALQEFHLKCKLHGGDPYASYRDRTIRTPDAREARLGLERSMEALERLKSGKKKADASPSFGIGDGGDADLAPLNKVCPLPCLESHLRKVRLEFELKRFDCFEVRLAKFLVENALVLEEMEVLDGDQRVFDHIHRHLPIWRASSSKGKIKIVGECNNGSLME
ncbi:unnamed protein product [Urochloa decumbens]|uniref:FBD domain-containing protein n=1 Tax=Urochloa decumbens TaxID=240449 RepID=A0ABC8YTN3_9POAL